MKIPRKCPNRNEWMKLPSLPGVGCFALPQCVGAKAGPEDVNDVLLLLLASVIISVVPMLLLLLLCLIHILPLLLHFWRTSGAFQSFGEETLNAKIFLKFWHKHKQWIAAAYRQPMRCQCRTSRMMLEMGGRHWHRWSARIEQSEGRRFLMWNKYYNLIIT